MPVFSKKGGRDKSGADVVGWIGRGTVPEGHHDNSRPKTPRESSKPTFVSSTPAAWQGCRWRISDYMMAGVRAGLTLKLVSEHAADEALAAQSPRAAKYLGWPMLLLMRVCRK